MEQGFLRGRIFTHTCTPYFNCFVIIFLFKGFHPLLESIESFHYHCNKYQDGGMDGRTDRQTDDGQHVIRKIH